MIESPPSSAAAASTAVRIASGSPTSTPYAGPPISPATVFADSSSTSKTATRAPSSAMRRQVARPMPDPPPVTTAHLPSSSPIARFLPVLGPPIQPRWRLEDQRLVQLPYEQLLRHAQVQHAVLAVHG